MTEDCRTDYFFSLVLVNIREALADVANVLLTVWLIDEAHVQYDATAHATCKVTEGCASHRAASQVVSWLRHELHIWGEGTTLLHDFCVQQFDFTEYRC